MRKVVRRLLPSGFVFFSLVFCCPVLQAQQLFAQAKNAAVVPAPVVHNFTPAYTDVFGAKKAFITNIGQYGHQLPGFEYLGSIYSGYEGLAMPVLFTGKGIIFLQRKFKMPGIRDVERWERKGMSEDEIREKIIPLNKTVAMEWVNANANAERLMTDSTSFYFTYGTLKTPAAGFKKMLCKDVYPGIDILYDFTTTAEAGYHYNIIVHPGADINTLAMRFTGDVTGVKTDARNRLLISSSINTIIQSAPVAFYEGERKNKLPVTFRVGGNTVQFVLPANRDNSKTIIIDPFVTDISGDLTSTNNNYKGKAKDIDFDYQGNVYVSGGGDGSVQKLAKYDAGGALKWVFSGSLTVPVWTFGGAEGGWVVEKISGNAFVGQGLPSASGFQVIRLTTNGIYDNYISTANPNFGENWRMLWNCNGGTPRILVAGGGGTANNELAIIAPPNTNPTPSNISGLSGGHNDISDLVIDPLTEDMYSIFSISVLSPTSDSKIYKHTPPYAPSNIAWTALTGVFNVKEPYNRPYLGGGLDNSSNTIAINGNYLFYWDGINLRAFSKSTGALTGTPVTLPATRALMSGGIFADECGNVFVGYTGNTIKVYKFDGNSFDDTAAPDIIIKNAGAESVYDITYDHGKNMIYACGSNFVAAADVSQYCTQQVYDVVVTADVNTLSAAAVLTPAPPAGSTISFSLFNGSTLITTNTTGIFTGLATGIVYTVKAYINEACSGTQIVKDFTFTGPPPPVLPPGIYVPSAFTPNGDGTNDVLRAIVSGLKEFHYFTVYNRYGQVVFTTTDPANGWDGTFDGVRQHTGSFVWMLEVVDQTGTLIRQKGNVTLIR
ncbi:MAG: gliding motility-associated C-terminal domain-containing protein [Bacteroidetes bacterium]|nr:gliding motility-associated C-terminal domain-containing protein [Bacteroidota bacterium]